LEVAVARRTWRRQAAALGVSLAVCFAAAGLGSLFTRASVSSWYQTLAKPSYAPPDWVFGPVWSLLYAMMAVAAWLVWRQGAATAGSALRLFALQLALNVAWSALFFGLRLPGWAAVELAALWLAIAATAAAFARRSPAAAGLLVPYLAWVAFAGVLNFGIWRLNA
jgi:tryptophan-rich sensory protein